MLDGQSIQPVLPSFRPCTVQESVQPNTREPSLGELQSLILTSEKTKGPGMALFHALRLSLEGELLASSRAERLPKGSLIVVVAPPRVADRWRRS